MIGKVVPPSSVAAKLREIEAQFGVPKEHIIGPDKKQTKIVARARHELIIILRASHPRASENTLAAAIQCDRTTVRFALGLNPRKPKWRRVAL